MRFVLTSNWAERAEVGTDTGLIATSTSLAEHGRTTSVSLPSGHSEPGNSFMPVSFKSEIGQGLNALAAGIAPIARYLAWQWKSVLKIPCGKCCSRHRVLDIA